VRWIDACWTEACSTPEAKGMLNHEACWVMRRVGPGGVLGPEACWTPSVPRARREPRGVLGRGVLDGAEACRAEQQRDPPVTPRLCSARTTPTACAHGAGASAGGTAALCGALCVRIMRPHYVVHYTRKRCALYASRIMCL